jgi:hypothetical protein
VKFPDKWAPVEANVTPSQPFRKVETGGPTSWVVWRYPECPRGVSGIETCLVVVNPTKDKVRETSGLGRIGNIRVQSGVA